MSESVDSVRIPKLGMAMTEGTLISWLVEGGATISAGDPIYLLETDKVESEIEAQSSGTIRIIGVEGTVYMVGDVVAEIRSPG